MRGWRGFGVIISCNYAAPLTAPHACACMPAALPATGLAGFVQYPTQQLVSGLAPLSQINSISNMTTVCIKPGQALPDFTGEKLIRDQQASFEGPCGAGFHLQL